MLLGLQWESGRDSRAWYIIFSFKTFSQFQSWKYVFFKSTDPVVQNSSSAANLLTRKL